MKNTRPAPTNTSASDPMEFLMAAMTGGSDFAITSQEAQGQREMVQSDVLPVRTLRSERADYEALGFVFGEPVDGDALFCYATLPEGWSREGSDHDMWSYIVDEGGARRVAIFYKAAFYDRKAAMSLEPVCSS